MIYWFQIGFRQIGMKITASSCELNFEEEEEEKKEATPYCWWRCEVIRDAYLPFTV